MKDSWDLTAIAGSDVNRLEFEICLNDPRNDRCRDGSAFTAIVGEGKDDDFRIIVRCICKRPRMCGPGAKLTSVRLTRHIITIFRGTSFSRNGDWNGICLVEYPVQGSNENGKLQAEFWSTG